MSFSIIVSLHVCLICIHIFDWHAVLAMHVKIIIHSTTHEQHRWKQTISLIWLVILVVAYKFCFKNEIFIFWNKKGCKTFIVSTFYFEVLLRFVPKVNTLTLPLYYKKKYSLAVCYLVFFYSSRESYKFWS